MRRRAPLLALLVALAAIAVVLVLVLEPDEGTAGPPDPVTVSPVPGGRWASPGTEISLRGLPPQRLGTIEVSGSKSGKHQGRFEPGEEVKVSTHLTVPGGHDGDYRFWVSRPAEPPPPRAAERPGGPVRHFASRPDLTTPAVEVPTHTPGRTPGLIFIAPKRGSGMDGAMIVDDAG